MYYDTASPPTAVLPQWIAPSLWIVWGNEINLFIYTQQGWEFHKGFSLVYIYTKIKSPFPALLQLHREDSADIFMFFRVYFHFKLHPERFPRPCWGSSLPKGRSIGHELLQWNSGFVEMTQSSVNPTLTSEPKRCTWGWVVWMDKEPSREFIERLKEFRKRGLKCMRG